MNKVPELIVMLTYNDLTVRHASDIFEQCKNSKATYWGFKEEGLPLEEMKALFGRMKACGKNTGLEVVAYTENEGMNGAKMAAQCGCDMLMGTIYSDAINDFCKVHHLKYMPFVGKVSERPSILEGNIDEMIAEARYYLSKGVYGIDLLGYRYTQDAKELNRRFVEAVDAPVCIAGSINSYERLDEIKEINPWSFTIGSAFFDHAFGQDFNEQINCVCDYMEKENV